MPKFARLSCACFLLAAPLSLADELGTSQSLTVEPEEPIAPSPCCGAAIVPAGNFEIEANYAADGLKGSIVHGSNLTLKFSLTNALQLQLATPNLASGGAGTPTRGFDGISPGLKFVFLEEGDLTPQLAVSAHAVFPTLTSPDAAQTTIDAYAMVYASKDVGPIHFDVTASVLAANLTGAPLLQGGASLGATVNLSDQWGIATGPYSSFGSADQLPVDGGWFGAVNFAPIPQLAISAGVEAGFFQQTREYSVFAGIAWVPTGHAGVHIATAPPAPATLTASR